MSRTDVSPHTPAVYAGRSPRSDGILALAGAGIFATIIVVLHVLEDDFDPSSRFISEYVLGDWGWLMNVAFLALGGAFLALAHGLRTTLSPGRRLTATVRLWYIVGFLQLVSGLFNSDSMTDVDAGRTSWHGALHDLSGLLGFVCVTVALFLLRGVFARDAQWQRFAPHALMFAIVSLAMFLLVVTAPTDTFGIAQRVFVTVAALSVGTLGCALLSAEPLAPGQHGHADEPE